MKGDNELIRMTLYDKVEIQRYCLSSISAEIGNVLLPSEMKLMRVT